MHLEINYSIVVGERTFSFSEYHAKGAGSHKFYVTQRALAQLIVYIYNTQKGTNMVKNVTWPFPSHDAHLEVKMRFKGREQSLGLLISEEMVKQGHVLTHIEAALDKLLEGTDALPKAEPN